MKIKKRNTVGEYTKRLKDLDLERFLNRNAKLNNWATKKKRSKKKNKKKAKAPQKSAWKKRYHEYLLSPEWATIRIEVLSDRKCCERCGSKKSLKVHHKNYDNIFHEEPEDLELLCKGCHDKEHNI